MRLFEAILEANPRAVAGEPISIDLQPYPDELPVVALTCIDPRLNRLLPKVLGIPEEQFIWLRNAGNIIFDPMSSMMRTLALACAIKGGKEIAIIGHTDCKVGKASVPSLLDSFRNSGVDRSRLPENLHDFFGLFASERQNVIRGTEFVRQSPLIGPKVFVHGLMLDTQTGRLEWIVNGYTASASPGATAFADQTRSDQPLMTGPLPAFAIGKMAFPDTKIGETATSAASPFTSSTVGDIGTSAAASVTPQQPQQEVRRVEIRRGAESAAPEVAPSASPLKISLNQMYHVMGDDQKVYGPVLGKEIQRWIEEGRIDLNTLAQKVGYKNWKRLADFAEEMERHSSTPPTVPPSWEKRR